MRHIWEKGTRQRGERNKEEWLGGVNKIKVYTCVKMP
jgi:hypothetical protein